MALQEAPPFWWKKPGWQAWLLSPFSWIYGRVSKARLTYVTPVRIAAPVICIGNFIAGGGGKTPTCIAFASTAKQMGLNPGLLSRGHGGAVTTPTLVDLVKHNAHDVGDEPLLLAQAAPTVVSSNRVDGANLLIAQGCDLIIMDDGFQNPSLFKDQTVAVVDSGRGIGNGYTHPAGPLRLPVSHQLPMADSILIVGKQNGADKLIRKAAKQAKPIAQAIIRVLAPEKIAGKWVLAYAGIADPGKFYRSVESTGAKIMERQDFGDHHHFLDDEIEELLAKAKVGKMQLVSTAKDKVRLEGKPGLFQQLLEATHILEIGMDFEDPAFIERTIKAAIKSFQSTKSV